MKKILITLLSVFLTVSILIPFTAFAADTGFKDVKDTAWYAPYVKYCTKNELVNGVGNNYFDPNGEVKRSEFVALLARYAKVDITEYSQTELPFSDVKTGKWFYEYVAWAYSNKIVNGTTDTTYEPDLSITREQLCAIVCRFAEFMEYEMPDALEGTLFTDEKDIRSYAKDAVKKCAAAGIVTGMDTGAFCPRDTATRAQACAILMRFVRYFTTKIDETESQTVPGRVDLVYSDCYGVYATGYYINGADYIIERRYEEDGYWYIEKWTENTGENFYTYEDSDGLKIKDTYDESGNLIKHEYKEGNKKGYTVSFGMIDYDKWTETFRIGSLKYEDTTGFKYERIQEYQTNNGITTLYVVNYKMESPYKESYEFCYVNANKLETLRYSDSDAGVSIYAFSDFNGPKAYPTSMELTIDGVASGKLYIDYNKKTATFLGQPFDYNDIYSLIDSLMTMAYSEYIYTYDNYELL